MSRGRRKVVCSFCRKRKIKCDMASPCQNCVRFGQEDCDITLVPGWTPNMAAANRVLKPPPEGSDVEFLKQRLSSLESLISGISVAPSGPTQINITGMANITPGHPDAGFSFYKEVKTVDYLDTVGMRRPGLLRWLVPVSLDERLFRLCQHAIPRKRLDLIQEASMRPDVLVTGQLCSESGCDGAATSEFKRENGLAVEIQKILPHKRVLWQLFDRFFHIIYPFVPILDEQDFRTAITGIVGKRSLSEEPTVVTISKETDFALMGILLVVLRMSHLSLFNVRNYVRSFCFCNSHLELEYLAQVEILPTSINIAEECLKEFDLIKDVKLEVVQLVTLLRTSMMFNPSNVNPDIQNLTYLAILNLLAYTRWLHRDPRQVFNIETISLRKTALLRKIWYTILHLDFSTLVFSGNLPTIGPDTYDVELPISQSIALNIEYTKLDAAVCEEFAKFAKLRVLLAEALKLLGKVSGEVLLHETERMTEILKAKEIELYDQVIQDSSSQTHNLADMFLRVSDYHSYLMVYFMYVGFCTHLHYYFVREHKSDLAFKYRSKIISVMCSHFLPFTIRLLDEERTPFGASSDMFTSAISCHCVIQSVTLIWSTYIDFRTQMHYIQTRPGLLSHPVSGPGYQSLYSALNEVTNLLHVVINVMCKALSVIQDRHRLYNRILKVHELILKLATSTKYYEQHAVLTIELATVTDVEEITSYVNQCLEQDYVNKLSPEIVQLMTPSPSSTTSVPNNSFSQFEPNFNLLLFEDLFGV